MSVYTNSLGTTPEVNLQELPGLTSIWTPPAACTNYWAYVGKQTQFGKGQGETVAISAGSSALHHWHMSSALLHSDYSSCQPSYGLTRRQYSPGICTFGQTLAAVTAYRIRSSGSTKTIWGGHCCNSGMTLNSTLSTFCKGRFSTPFALMVLITFSSIITSRTAEGPFVGVTSTTVGFEITYLNHSKHGYEALSSTTTALSGLAIAEPIEIYWEQRDLSEFPPEYASSVASQVIPASPASSSSLPPSTDTPMPCPFCRKSRGNQAVQIGIAFGALAAILLVIFVLLFLHKRRQKWKAATAATVASTSSNDHPATAELEDQDQTLAKRKWFLGGRWRSEAPVEEHTHELDSKGINMVPGPPVELDGEDVMRRDRNRD